MVSFLVCLFLVMSRDMHGHFTMDSHEGIQKVHKAPTPRVGGIGLVVAAIIGGLLLPAEAQALWWLLCLSALPAFLSGLAEDLTKRVGVKWRLSATALSGLIFTFLTGYSIDHVNIPGADWLLAFPAFSLVFTAFAISGIANAINIIDGFNGLASGCSIIVMGCFAYVAWSAGDTALFNCALLTLGALAGFFLLNFPFGKIFLGDAGAYSVGFLLAVVAVALPARNPEVSPLIGLVALSYPVTETMVSIWRRMKRDGTDPGQPDRLHLHSLVHRSLARGLAKRIGHPDLRNPMTSVVMWIFPLLSSLFVVIGNQVNASIPALVAAIVIVYLRFYRRVALLGPMVPGYSR
ncbi:MraY family glycosyltransferase [Actibacterium sp. D379-3]